MPFTTNYSRGEIVLVPFPFTDLSGTKQRPALVISPDSLNSTRDDLLLAGITSQVPVSVLSDEFIIPNRDLPACGLPKPSIVRLTKVFSLHRRLVIKRLRKLPNGTLVQLLAQVRQLF
jgi:mRNA interferase MazF